MSPLELSIDTLERAQERFLETLDQMTVAEANTMPKPLIKSVTWLIWHSSRVLDYQISPLAGLPKLYETAGFKERFNLDLPDDTQDWRHTPFLRITCRPVWSGPRPILINWMKLT